MATDVQAGVRSGIYLSFPDQLLSLDQLTHELEGLQQAWQGAFKLSLLRSLAPDPLRELPAPPTASERKHELETMRRPTPDLFVERIIRSSPMELLLQLPVAAAGGVGAYALHLLVKALAHPHQVGAWLPRLAAGWYGGHAEMYAAKRKALNERQRSLEKGIDRLPLLPAEVSALGAGPTPTDLQDVE